MRIKKNLLLAFASISLFFTGCRKEIETKTEDVTATIVGSYHQDKIEDRWYDWDLRQWKSKIYQYEENIIYVECNGKEYEFNGESYYRHYGNRKGDQITASLITHIYDDGTEKQELLLD